jgi:hypothetical protein
MKLTPLNRILLLITCLLAAYQVVVGINGMESIPTIAYTVGFGMLLVAGLLMLILAYSLGVLLAGCQRDQKAALPPPLVEVVNVLEKDVPIQFEWIATTDGLVNATIRAQVMGYLIKQDYREGQFVKKGQILFEIDPRPFERLPFGLPAPIQTEVRPPPHFSGIPAG